MQDFIEKEFSGSDLHQQLFEILIEKYHIRCENGFKRKLKKDENFQIEYGYLVDSYNDFISSQIEEDN